MITSKTKIIQSIKTKAIQSNNKSKSLSHSLNTYINSDISEKNYKTASKFLLYHTVTLENCCVLMDCVFQKCQT